MFTPQEMAFAQRYPYSSIAREIVKQNSSSLERISEETRNRAASLVLSAFKGKKDMQKHSALRSTDVMLQEILAFPLAKILLSLLRQQELYNRFAGMYAESTFAFLEHEKNKRESLFELAANLGAKFSPSEKNGVFVELPLLDFLLVPPREPFMKLVNQRVESGIVFLNENDFCRFVSGLAGERIRTSLPVNIGSAPKELKAFAEQLSRQLVVKQKRIFAESFASAGGKVAPEAFPPCYAELYSALLAGKNLPHLSRFDLVVFLGAIGMPQEQIAQLFKNAPNFNERITRYQVGKILGARKYSVPSCAKVKEHGFCVTNCDEKHPLGYYRRQLRAARTGAKMGVRK